MEWKKTEKICSRNLSIIKMCIKLIVIYTGEYFYKWDLQLPSVLGDPTINNIHQYWFNNPFRNKLSH